MNFHFRDYDKHILGGFMSVLTESNAYTFCKDPNTIIYYLRTRNRAKRPICDLKLERNLMVMQFIVFGSVTIAMLANDNNDENSNFVLTADYLKRRSS